jgi:hypothetical protein
MPLIVDVFGVQGFPVERVRGKGIARMGISI